MEYLVGVGGSSIDLCFWCAITVSVDEVIQKPRAPHFNTELQIFSSIDTIYRYQTKQLLAEHFVPLAAVQSQPQKSLAHSELCFDFVEGQISHGTFFFF